MKTSLIILGALGVLLLCLAGWFVVSYNGLVSLDESVQTEWSNLQSNYQRRADLYATQLPVMVAASAQELAVFKELNSAAIMYSRMLTAVEGWNWGLIVMLLLAYNFFEAFSLTAPL